MNLQLIIYCPDDDKVINKIIGAASRAGAGVIGNYSQCAFITKGISQWKSENGSNPTIGKVGELTKISGAKIEMICPQVKRNTVERAIRSVHPYEEPDIQFIQIVS